MPQMNKGGKFIFGKSLIREDLTIQLPSQALSEYNATMEGKVYLFTGSKITDGFCVTRRGLLKPSKKKTRVNQLENRTACPGFLLKCK